MTPEGIFNLLRFLATHDLHDDVWWDEDLRFFVKCNDLFWWATADAEELTDNNLPAYRQAVEDAIAACELYGTIYGSDLFCCRQRQMRPQNCHYAADKFLGRHPELVPLFHACGPSRTDKECG